MSDTFSTFVEADAGPSSTLAHARLHERLSKAATSKRAQNHRSTLNGNRRGNADDDDDDDDGRDDDALFDELERELEEDEGRGHGMMGRLREERMEELRKQIRQEEARHNLPKGTGTVTEPTNEKELMQILGDRGGDLDAQGAGGQPIIVHFYHKEFQRCDIMNSHLEILAAQHPEALFLKMSVLASPFLVEKLAVKVLPCLIVFGLRVQVKDRIVGFEDLGNADSFTTRTLEWRLAQGGALREKQSDSTSFGPQSIGLGSYVSARAAADDEDLDWD